MGKDNFVDFTEGGRADGSIETLIANKEAGFIAERLEEAYGLLRHSLSENETITRKLLIIRRDPKTGIQEAYPMAFVDKSDRTSRGVFMWGNYFSSIGELNVLKMRFKRNYQGDIYGDKLFKNVPFGSPVYSVDPTYDKVEQPFSLKLTYLTSLEAERGDFFGAPFNYDEFLSVEPQYPGFLIYNFGYGAEPNVAGINNRANCIIEFPNNRGLTAGSVFKLFQRPKTGKRQYPEELSLFFRALSQASSGSLAREHLTRILDGK